MNLYDVKVDEFEFWPVPASFDPMSSAAERHRTKVPFVPVLH